MALRLLRASAEDLPRIDALFDQLTTYSMIVDGVARCKDAADDFLSARPLNCVAAQKHPFIAMEGTTPVGLVDLIARYPDETTAFIGLLAIAEPRQRIGLGRQMYEQTEHFARLELGAAKLVLAVVSTNPVAGFWTRMGFRPKGDLRRSAGQSSTRLLQMMEKTLKRPLPKERPLRFGAK